jgi:hypothetical protein
MKRLKTFYKNLDVDNTSELLEFYNPYSRQFDKPTHWLDGRKPVIGIFCDDIQSSPLIGSKAFRHLCIMSRHVGAFEDGEPPIGCSLFICVQNYTSQGNEGIPKSIRGNITLLCDVEVRQRQGTGPLGDGALGYHPKRRYIGSL